MLAMRGNIHTVNTTATKACASSSRWLHQQQQKAQESYSSSSSSSSSSNWGNASQNLTALAATALGLGGSAAMVTACEKSQQDPMTKYATPTTPIPKTTTTTSKIATTIATSASNDTINSTTTTPTLTSVHAISPDVLANNATNNESDQTADEKRLEDAAHRAKKTRRRAQNLFREWKYGIIHGNC